MERREREASGDVDGGYRRAATALRGLLRPLPSEALQSSVRAIREREEGEGREGDEEVAMAVGCGKPPCGSYFFGTEACPKRGGFPPSVNLPHAFSSLRFPPSPLSNHSHGGPQSSEGFGSPPMTSVGHRWPFHLLPFSLSSFPSFSLAPVLPAFRIKCPNHIGWPAIWFGMPRIARFKPVW